MMNTLLMRFCAPMQSWGVESRFTIRDSGLEPSKSGVIGLICAALGRPREADVSDLARLRMGVRVDKEGVLQSDYQIAQNVLLSDGKKEKASIPSTRYYLADAAFLVGLEGENETLLKEINRGLQHPVWVLFLGRKAFVPSRPVSLGEGGLQQGKDLETSLNDFPVIDGRQGRKPAAQLRLVIESKTGEQMRNDVPVSFLRREFAPRRVHTSLIATPQTMWKEGPEDVPVSVNA